MVSYDPPYGYALRINGTCPADSIKCYDTWDGIVACCPSGTDCAPQQTAGNTDANPVCCPSNADCRNPLGQSPHCGDPSWMMYNHEGFFCCADGQSGYFTSNQNYNNSVACAKPVAKGPLQTVLNAVSQTVSSSTFISSPTAAPTSTSSSSSSSSKTGGIAGGVVGGVAGVALIAVLTWFLIRRRRKQKQQNPVLASEVPGTFPDSSAFKEPTIPGPSELEEQNKPSELENPADQPVHELPASPVVQKK